MLKRFAALTLLAFAVSLIAARPSYADPRLPVVVIHGFEYSAANHCGNTWGDLIDFYKARSSSLTTPIAPTLYYSADGTCSDSATLPDGSLVVQNLLSRSFGTHSVHSGHTGDDHGINTSIRHLGYHFAWAVYSKYTQNNKAVDVVAHSMGGLITRYALQQVEAGNASFPPSLDIARITTLGTPHGGTNTMATEFCANALDFFGDTTQCKEMLPGSSFMASIGTNLNPQGSSGSSWSTAGSQDDKTVPWKSAIAMGSDRKVTYDNDQGICHGCFMHKTRFVEDAKVILSQSGTTGTRDSYFWPVKLTWWVAGTPVTNSC